MTRATISPKVLAATMASLCAAGCLTVYERTAAHAPPSRFAPVDLRAAANMGLADETAGDGRGGFLDTGEADLRFFDPRRRIFGGLPFWIPDQAGKAACITVALGGALPSSSAPIRLPAQKCDWLYFLHASASASGTAAVYSITFADGRVVTVPVVIGKGVRPAFSPPAPIPDGVVGYVGYTTGGTVSLYVHRWRNPYPDVEPQSVTVSAAAHAPFCLLGVTAQEGRQRVLLSDERLSPERPTRRSHTLELVPTGAFTGQARVVVYNAGFEPVAGPAEAIDGFVSFDLPEGDYRAIARSGPFYGQAVVSLTRARSLEMPMQALPPVGLAPVLFSPPLQSEHGGLHPALADSLRRLPSILDRHRDWGVELRVPGWAIERLQTADPDALDRLTRAAAGGRLGMALCEYRARRAGAFPPGETLASLALSARLMAEAGMNASDTAAIDEGHITDDTLALLEGCGVKWVIAEGVTPTAATVEATGAVTIARTRTVEQQQMAIRWATAEDTAARLEAEMSYMEAMGFSPVRPGEALALLTPQVHDGQPAASPEPASPADITRGATLARTWAMRARAAALAAEYACAQGRDAPDAPPAPPEAERFARMARAQSLGAQDLGPRCASAAQLTLDLARQALRALGVKPGRVATHESSPPPLDGGTPTQPPLAVSVEGAAAAPATAWTLAGDGIYRCDVTAAATPGAGPLRLLLDAAPAAPAAPQYCHDPAGPVMLEWPTVAGPILLPSGMLRLGEGSYLVIDNLACYAAVEYDRAAGRVALIAGADEGGGASERGEGARIDEGGGADGPSNEVALRFFIVRGGPQDAAQVSLGTNIYPRLSWSGAGFPTISEPD